MTDPIPTPEADDSGCECAHRRWWESDLGDYVGCGGGLMLLGFGVAAVALATRLGARP